MVVELVKSVFEPATPKIAGEAGSSVEEQPRPSVIGGIIFNEGKSVPVLGDSLGRLVTRTVSTTDLDPTAPPAIKESMCFVSLNSFQQVKIRQVDIEGVEVTEYPTALKIPTISLAFNVTDPETQETERLVTDEVGLLFEQPTTDGTEALVRILTR